MERSENIDKISAALVKFQGLLSQPKLNNLVKVRTKTGGEYTFKYADFSGCKEAAKQPLSECELAVTQLIEEDYSVLTMLIHSSGQYMSSKLKMPIGENSAQAIGSSLTYAKRYAYCAILGIVADDDDDANIPMGNDFKKSEINKPSIEPQKPTKKTFNLKLLDSSDFF